MHFGYFAIGCGSGVVGEDGGEHGVVAPFFSFDIGIDDGQIHFFCNDLGAFEYGCVLIEEGGPICVFGLWGLVGNEYSSGELVFMGNHFFIGCSHGDHAGAKAAAHAMHKAIETFICKWVVNDIQLLPA